MTEQPLEVRWLGRMPFEAALDLQTERVAAVAEGRSPETLFLLEHDPVYTIGRTRDQSSLLAAVAGDIPVHIINRGGQATWHGPGQLVGYPILDLRKRVRDLHRYLRFLEGTLIDLLSQYGIEAGRSEGLTGVWSNGRKLASLGVGVRRWITMHGFALNVCNSNEGFDRITPCGIHGVRMSSLSSEAGKEIPVKQVADAYGILFERRLATAPDFSEE